MTAGSAQLSCREAVALELSLKLPGLAQCLAELSFQPHQLVATGEQLQVLCVELLAAALESFRIVGEELLEPSLQLQHRRSDVEHLTVEAEQLAFIGTHQLGKRGVGAFVERRPRCDERRVEVEVAYEPVSGERGGPILW